MSVIKNVVKTITEDGKGDQETEEKLAELDEIATTKLKQMDDSQLLTIQNGEIPGSTGHTLPVKETIGTSQRKHSITKSEYDIPDIVKKVMSELNAPTPEGSKIPVLIGEILNETLTAITGEEEGDEEEVENYAIVVEAGALVRYDVSTWTKSIDTRKIKSSARKITCAVCRRSSVKMSEVDLNTFKAVYGTYAEFVYPELSGLKLDAKVYLDWIMLGGRRQPKVELELDIKPEQLQLT